MDNNQKPNQSFSKENWQHNIAKYMFDYIFLNDELFWKEIEIEAKLGKVLFEGKCEQIYSKISYPFLISGKFRNTKDNFITFDAGVSKESFLCLFEEIKKEFSDKKEKIIGPISSCDYDGKGYRKSVISNDTVEVIKKMNKTNYDIRNCGSDIRFSILREKKYDANKEIRMSGYVREKTRISFWYENYVLDFTVVNSHRNKESQGQKFEIELEFFKLRENPFLFKENFSLFEKTIKEMYERVSEFYTIIQNKEKNIECSNISELLKNFNC
jgi:hypothetical protein